MSDPKTVLDYYKLLKWKHLAAPFVFARRGDKWIAVEGDGYDFDSPGTDWEKDRLYPVDIDIANGYLEITDEGTGGGTAYTQIALFRRADNSAFAALNFFGMGIDYVEASSPKFYSWNGSALTDITSSVFPDSLVQEKTRNRFSLPRVGTVIHYSLYKGDSTNSEHMDVAPTKDIEIPFDKVAGKFFVKPPKP